LFKVSAIIPAAGSGSRFGERKQFKLLNGQPLWCYTLAPFVRSKLINEIVFVVPEEFISTVLASKNFKSLSKNKDIKVVAGGSNRTKSVLNGILSTNKTNDLICIHDAARPFIKDSLITKTVNACKEFDGSILAIPSNDTIKIVQGGIIEKTIDRRIVRMAQTPQTFHKNKLLDAYKNNVDSNVTDECTIMELSGYSIKIIDGDNENLKITNSLDWEMAKIKVVRK
tara:strand:- start:4338 stop:5015 length:678 start_codon:yes stop_codon:yes gene_type:complete